MSDSADRVRDLLEHVSDALALDATVEIVEEGREIHATLEGEDLGLFIGRHGQTIDAVQHLAFKTATRDQPPSAGVRVVVDAAGYRERREQALQRQADEAAADAVRSKPPGRARRDERHRAQGRARVPQGPRRRGDVLGGHRARPASRRCAPRRESAFHVKHLADVAPAVAVGPLERILELQAVDPTASTSVRDIGEAIDRHVADSLTALPFIGSPPRIADLGSGAGWPGLALAAALPEAEVWLVETAIRHCRYLERAVEVSELSNVERGQ